MEVVRLEAPQRPVLGSGRMTELTSAYCTRRHCVYCCHAGAQCECPCHEEFASEGYGLSRIKRSWVPECVWSVFCWKNLATWEPFKHILTRKATQADIDAIEQRS